MGRRSLTPTSPNTSDSESSDDDEPKDIGKNTVTTANLTPATTFMAFEDLQESSYNKLFHIFCFFLFVFLLLQN